MYYLESCGKAYKDLATRDTCGKASVKSFRSSFPSSKDGVSTKKHGLVSSVPKPTKKIFTAEKRKILESQVRRDKSRPTVKDLATRDTCGKASVKSFRSSFPSSKDGVSTKKHGLVSSVPEHLRKRKEVDPFRKSNLVPNKSQKMMEYGESREAGKKKVELNEAREPRKNKTDSISPKEPGSENFTLDTDSQRRLLAIMKKAKEEITMDTILKKYKGPSTYRSSTMNACKTISMGKVEGSVQAVRTALKKLEEGGSIEDAKAICEPEHLNQIFKWKVRLTF